MNQALDEAIRKTIGAVETVAPKAWETAVQFERVEAAVSLVNHSLACAWWLIAFVAGALMLRSGIKAFNVNDPDPPGRLIGGTILVGMSFLCGWFSLTEIPRDVARYQHPDVYAARSLMDRVAQ